MFATDEYKIKIKEIPEHDLALDYYYTPESGQTTEEAMQRYEKFYQEDFNPWAMRINAREHVFLYITKFGTSDLPQLYVKNNPEAHHLEAEVMLWAPLVAGPIGQHLFSETNALKLLDIVF